MAKEFWEDYENEPPRFDEDGEQHRSDDAHEGMWIHKDTRQTTASSSLICPDTGKVTSHNSDDLRAQLTQARLARESVSSPATSEPPTTLASAPWELVALDDELHGPDGERLMVTAVSPNMRVLTLQCLHSCTIFERAASDVRADIGEHRLKVHRYWWDLPDEGEEYE